MGCDIHTYVERRDEGGTWLRVDWPGADDGPFDWRSYNVFGFLADVRNYSVVPPLAAPRGLPEDASTEVCREWDHWESDGFSCSWFTVAELATFDYDAEFEDRRVTINGNGGRTAEPGSGQITTYREFLGPSFFRDLAVLRDLDVTRATRVVFWFD